MVRISQCFQCSQMALQLPFLISGRSSAVPAVPSPQDDIDESEISAEKRVPVASAGTTRLVVVHFSNHGSVRLLDVLVCVAA
jgi:hypothetical protein